VLSFLVFSDQDFRDFLFIYYFSIPNDVCVSGWKNKKIERKMYNCQLASNSTPVGFRTVEPVRPTADSPLLCQYMSISKEEEKH